MAITLVSSVGTTPGQHGGTSSALTTTGATLLVLSAGWYAGAGTEDVTISDSKGNPWTALTKHVGATGRHRLFYSFSPVVGSGHTFTVSGTNTYPAFLAYAFAGVTGGVDVESGNGHASTSPVASGSVTPTVDGALILTAIGANEAATDSLSPGGFTATTVPSVASVSVQNTSAYYVQPTAAAINPTWSWTGTHSGIAVSTAVFRAASPGPLVAWVAANPGPNGGTTAAIDTTGATLLVVSVAWVGGTSATVSDSKGNTWIGLTTRQQGTNGTSLRLWYCLTPTVGSGHTFTSNVGFSYPGFQAYAFASLLTYQTEVGTTSTGAGPLATGSVTPTANGALVFTSRAADGAGETETVSPSGFTLTAVVGVGANNAHCGVGYVLQPTAAAINPTWAWTPNISTQKVVTTAVFLPAAAAVATAQPYVWGPL